MELLVTDEVFDDISRELQRELSRALSVPSTLMILEDEKPRKSMSWKLKLIRFNSVKQKRRKEIENFRHSKINEPLLS